MCYGTPSVFGKYGRELGSEPELEEREYNSQANKYRVDKVNKGYTLIEVLVGCIVAVVLGIIGFFIISATKLALKYCW